MNLVAVEARQIEQTLELLKNGGVIIYPTETVYGLGCLASITQAIDRIAELKGSADGANYLLLVKSADSLRRYCRIIPQLALDLARRFWPGPLTLILPAVSGLHSRLVGPTGGVAVRMSSYPWCIELMDRLGEALISTSANQTRAPAPDSPKVLDKELVARVDAVIDGGVLSGMPSTLLDLCADPPVLLRIGAISRQEIESVIGLW
ncbi:MAG: L-threonylcarbamoyladenylate synthase [bacterium]|nr:L-threonylcarbamoyladenylate synthase [bacterium]